MLDTYGYKKLAEYVISIAVPLQKRTACWIPMATKKLAEYVVSIAVPLQKRLRERLSVRFHVNYLSCFVFTYCVQQSLSSEGNQFSASQKIPRTVWNP